MNKLNVDYASDLHVSHYVPFHNNQEKWERQTKEWTKELLRDAKGEVLILAGDFSEWNAQSKWLIEECAAHYEQVFFTIGNHDYYLLSKNQQKKYGNSINRALELVDLVKDIPNVQPLLGDNVVYKGFTFAGHPLWYNPKTPGEINWFETFSNDSRYIFVPKGYNQTNFDVLHEQAMVWYKSVEDQTIDVFVSHVPPVHPPSNRNRNDGDATYVADVPFLANTKHWVCGHQHHQVSFNKFDIQFHMNPVGYPDEDNYVNVRSFELVAD